MTELSTASVAAPDGSSRSRIVELYGLRFRLWPIVAVGLLMEPLLRLGREPARWIWHHGPADWANRPWIFVGLAIILQALVGLAAIMLMRRFLPKADAHLRLPAKGEAMIGTATLLGVGMALAMLVADYWPQIIGGTAPTDYPIDPVNSTGWIIAMAITGFAEEPIFRGLMVGALAVLVPGRLRIGKFDLPIAAYIVALLFGIAHWQNFAVRPFYMAAAQQIYAFAWGLIYAWLMERSRSLVAPIIAHGLSDAVEVGLVMVLRAALS